MVHELVHVYQFERVGSVYIPKALWAQWTSGYRYGGTPQLIRDRQEGKEVSGLQLRAAGPDRPGLLQGGRGERPGGFTPQPRGL